MVKRIHNIRNHFGSSSSSALVLLLQNPTPTHPRPAIGWSLGFGWAQGPGFLPSHVFMFVVMFSCQDIDLIPVSSSVAPERLAQLAEFALFGFECLASGLTRSLPWRALGLRAEFIPLWFWVFGLRADTLSALACAWPTGRVHSSLVLGAWPPG